MKPTHNLTLSLFLCTAISSSAYAVATCTQGTDCQVSINENTFNTNENVEKLTTEFTDNFAFGAGSFDTQTDTTKSSGTSINEYINNATYLASRFFILNLTLPTYYLSRFSALNFNPAVEGASTFSDQINTIHDITKTHTINNYFTPLSSINSINWGNGYYPILGLDISPYTFPRSSQLMKNSISSLTTMTFLNLLGGYQTITEDDTASFMSDKCYDTSSTNINYPSDPSASCLTPFQQLNVAGGCNFPIISNETQSTNYKTTAGTYSTAVPTFANFMLGNTAPQVMPSLSASTLMNSFTYNENQASITDTSGNTTSLTRDFKLGLYGLTELAAADNFVRYLSGELLPNTMTTQTEYDKYKDMANRGVCYQFRTDAAMKIKAYRLLLRNYAAQTSVGIDNLYYIMQKRRAVTVPGTSVTQTSQLEQEYKMATYRLFNSSSTASSKITNWQRQLKTANSSSIQQQMALLLAEINYQLFLNRKEQERILLTLSAMHLSNTSQLKKQLTINEAATYISPKPINNADTSCDPAGTKLGNADL